MDVFKLMLITAYDFPFLTQPAFVSTVSVLLSAVSVLCVGGRERQTKHQELPVPR